MKTNKPVTEGVDATVNVWFLGTCRSRINQTYIVVFTLQIQIIFGDSV